MHTNFWHQKNVFVTGHTGFKGSWLSLWLNHLGANVTGYALNPPTNPSMFDLTKLKNKIHSNIADIRNLNELQKSVLAAQPEIVFHLAAQPLVRLSYKAPVETYETNVMGTVNLLEAVRACPSVKAVVIITTDKCYENKEWCWGYKEIDPMGGFDPYSSSKGCAELVVSAYRRSFFNSANSAVQTQVASVRAGNVIGGGDWAEDRLIPDIIKALSNNKPVIIRNPNSIRPWQHVLEPLSGYMRLAELMYAGKGELAEGWNFGPNEADAKPVSWIVNELIQTWGAGKWEMHPEAAKQPHEATYLKLDISKAKAYLQWEPRWNLQTALNKTAEWFKGYNNNSDIYALSIKQIESYLSSSSRS